MRALAANDGDLCLVDLLEAQYIAAHAHSPSCFIPCVSSTERRVGYSVSSLGQRVYDTTRGLPQGHLCAVKLEWKGVANFLPCRPLPWHLLCANYAWRCGARQSLLRRHGRILPRLHWPFTW